MDPWGTAASLLIVAACAAGIHSIVDLRRKQAKALGVPYMDPARKAALTLAATVGGAYALFIAVVVLAGL
jgi:hypothetical protein